MISLISWLDFNLTICSSWHACAWTFTLTCVHIYTRKKSTCDALKLTVNMQSTCFLACDSNKLTHTTHALFVFPFVLPLNSTVFTLNEFCVVFNVCCVYACACLYYLLVYVCISILVCTVFPSLFLSAFLSFLHATLKQM